MQGRAKPRSFRVYEDWARLLGTARRPSWLIACTLDAFVEEVCRAFSAHPLELKRRAGVDGQRLAGETPGGAAVHYVCGAYAAYSHAWSPYFQGQLIRGSLLIQPSGAAGFPRAIGKACCPGRSS